MISSIIPPPKKIKLENGYTSLSTPVTGKIDSSLSKEAYRIHITEQTNRVNIFPKFIYDLCNGQNHMRHALTTPSILFPPIS